MSDIYTKSELIAAVSAASQKPRADVEAVLDAYLAVSRTALKEGRTLRLDGIGSISSKHQDARTARNPKTGETIQVPAKRVPKFSAAQALKDALNS